MRIAILDECPKRAEQLRDRISATADHEVHLLGEGALSSQLADIAPDLTVVSASHALRDVLEECFATNPLMGRPVTQFVDPNEARWNRSALAAGLAAYAVAGLGEIDLRTALDRILSLYAAQAGEGGLHG